MASTHSWIVVVFAAVGFGCRGPEDVVTICDCVDTSTPVNTADELAPPVALCTVDAEELSLPDAVFTFSDAGSYSEEGVAIIGYRWDLVEVPPTSEAEPRQNVGLQTSFEADLMGSYVMQLHVYDERGGESEAPCTLRVRVRFRY